MAAGVGRAGQQPPGDLPVTADPTVTAPHVRTEARRVALVELDVSDKRRPRVAAFQKVVAEDQILREAVAKRALEGIHVEDALAGERPLAEDVLVDIGDGARVGVDARLATEEAAGPRGAD